MWLLDTTTYRLRFEQDPSHVSYTILSHVWDVATEQTYQDLQAIHARARQGVPSDTPDSDPQLLAVIERELNAKIRDACAYARSRGHRYIWIDTCCIDKTSSAELSEALNSMFDWYSYAEVCYVFLPDVEDDEDPAPSHSGFSCSLWFKRGWTLQELIVPRINIFLSRSWRMLGTKASLAKTIARTTGIDKDILLHKRPLHSISVARRMSWASDRETSRVEDEAYCLMGLFGIRMPTIYGEGRQAFVRLQEEILKRIPDQSLFAWGRRLRYLPPDCASRIPQLQKAPAQELRASKGAYLFATAPADFSGCDEYDSISFSALAKRLSLPSSNPPMYIATSYGVRTTLPIFHARLPAYNGSNSDRPGSIEDFDVLVGLLACCDEEDNVLGLILTELEEHSDCEYLVSGYYPYVRPRLPTAPGKGLGKGAAMRYSRTYPRLLAVHPYWLSMPTRLENAPVLRDVCIPHQRLQVESELLVFRRPSAWSTPQFLSPCNVVVPRWTISSCGEYHVTCDMGVEVDDDGMMEPIAIDGSNPTHTFTLYRADEVITIVLSLCPSEESAEKPLHVNVAWARPQEPVPTLGASQALSVVLDNAHQHTCDNEHVSTWADGEKAFVGPSQDLTLTVVLSVWDAQETHGIGVVSCGLYALDLQFGPPLKL